jgi:hypothetical protein
VEKLLRDINHQFPLNVESASVFPRQGLILVVPIHVTHKQTMNEQYILCGQIEYTSVNTNTITFLLREDRVFQFIRPAGEVAGHFRVFNPHPQGKNQVLKAGYLFRALVRGI